MSLRILHALSTVNPSAGGPVEGVTQLTAVNLRYGHQIEVVTLDAPGSPWLERIPVPVHALGTGGKYGFSLRYVEWMRTNGPKYDSVIINGVWGFNAFGTWLALRNTTVPYFAFTHGMLDPWFKHHYPLKHLKKWLYWPWGLYPVLRDAEAVFFTCQREAELARESFWLYDCNEVVVRYGTSGIPDVDRNYREDFERDHPALRGTRNLLFLGRVHPKKGPDFLIEALPRLIREGVWDKNKMKLVMAGPVDSDYAASLKELARQRGVEDSIYWTGMLVGDQKWGAIQNADAFVLPSHQENFGIAVVEALSARVPVLITHAVNISPEIAADGAGLVDEDTVTGTYRLLRKWLRLDEEVKAEMRTQARATFLHRYTAEVGAKDMLRSIYLTLTARKIGRVTR